MRHAQQGERCRYNGRGVSSVMPSCRVAIAPILYEMVKGVEEGETEEAKAQLCYTVPVVVAVLLRTPLSAASAWPA